MAKRLFCADIEADELLENATKIWCASTTEISHKGLELESLTTTNMVEIAELFGNPDNILVMHNGIAYDKPVVEKILGIEVKAQIIDTLYLSWYLYPKMLRHGLATWGEELGIAKPVIDDWANLTIEEYKFRCSEDVRIQTALWKQMWSHLMLLYKSGAGCWHLINHLNFKARCAALQEKNRWKLDVNKTMNLEEIFLSKYNEAKVALEARMPEVPNYSTRKRPKKCYNAAGKVSALGLKWRALVEIEVDPELYYHGDPIDYKEDISVIKDYKPPNAGSHQQLKGWLSDLGWVPESFKYMRNKETNKLKKIPQIKNQETEELCDSIVRLIDKEPSLGYLREMSIVKHRIAVVQGFLKNVDKEGFVYAANQGLTNTLRFKHKICCNIPSTRKKYGEEIRSLLQARNSNFELCGSDLDSLEDRTKQHYMMPHDEKYVLEMMKPDFDPHCDMAMSAGLMTAEQAVIYKKFNKDDHTEEEANVHSKLSLVRYAGKSTNYAATYGATGPTIARSAGVEEEIGDLLHEAYWERNWSLTAIAQECDVKLSRSMNWLYNPVARIWIWLKADKDRFSTLNQSTATYAFDRWVYHILQQREQLTAQFHDEVVLEISKVTRELTSNILNSAMDKVNKELNLNRELSCGIDFGDTYAEIH